MPRWLQWSGVMALLLWLVTIAFCAGAGNSPRPRRSVRVEVEAPGIERAIDRAADRISGSRRSTPPKNDSSDDDWRRPPRNQRDPDWDLNP